MKITLNSINAVTGIITDDEPLRQGNVGANTLTAVFEGKSNLAYTATFNYTRSDDGRLKDIPLTPTANAGEYYYKFSNPWFFAVYGETTLTVYLKNSANEIVASGQITFSIEQTDFDDDPNITYSEYELLLDAITDKQDKFNLNNVRGYDTLALATTDLPNLIEGQIIIVKGDNATFYQVQSGSLIELIYDKADKDGDGLVIKSTYGVSVVLSYDSATDTIISKLYASDGTLLDTHSVELPKATTTENGLMAKEDKVKIDDLPTTYETIVNSDKKIKKVSGYRMTDIVNNALDTQMSCGAYTSIPDYARPVYVIKAFQRAVAISNSGIALYRNNGYPPNDDYVLDTYYATEKFVTDSYQPTSQKGQPSGYASLDSGGKVPSTQLPSYVDDVLEFANLASFPATGSASVIYVALDTNLTYRWSGSAYVEISPSLALGETSSTAYRGDKGKTAYDHSQVVSGNPHNVTKGDIGLDNVDNTSDEDKPISTATQTALDGKVATTRKILGIDLQDDITKPEFVEALCDGSLSATSNNPVKNKVISKVLDVNQHYYSVGTVKNDNAPGGISDIFSTWGMTFNKADLNGKDINKVITRLCCYKSGTTFLRTIRLKIYNTPFESATNLGTSTTLSAPIYYKDFVMTESPQNFEIDVAVAYDDLSTVFAVVFEDRSLSANNTSGLYISRANTDDILANKNGSVSAYYTDGTNYLRFGGNSYYASGYGNCYLSFGYVTLDIVKHNDLSGYVSNEEIGLEKQENPNIWNKNEQVLHSWASPSNGVIETYPDNPDVNNYLRSGYIPVKKNTEYILSIFQNVGYGGRVYACYYNKSKAFISGGQVNGTTAGPINGTTFTTPDNDILGYVIISINQTAITPLQLEEGDEASPYHEYTGDKYLADNLLITTDQIIDADTPESYINLPDELYAVVGDKFEMFYKGILNLKSYDNMYVQCNCDIGKSYQRKFELTPTTTNIGNHTLQVQVYDNNKVMIDSKTINLKVVAKLTSPANNKNILCMGDSLTEGGTWVAELHRRINLTSSSAVYGGDAPQGLGLTNITFVGKRQTANGAGFEGFGGWKFSTYLNPATSTDDYWISSDGHDKTNDDQESVWQASNGTQWQLETIETNRIKVKKYSGSGVLPASGTLAWVSGGIHTGNIIYTSSSLAEGNPFSYNGEIDFEAYCADLGISTIDEVYILLGWNDVGTALSTYKTQAKQFIDLLRAFNPSTKVILMGLEVPAADGMANNYGADSLYNYYKGQKFVFDLNNLYQEIASEYDSGVSFMNISSQFDTEYCMQTMQTTPNSRVSTEITIQSNGVHPAISGYYQIADVVYRWFNGNS